MYDRGPKRDTVEGDEQSLLALLRVPVEFIRASRYVPGVPGRTYRHIDYLWRADKKHR